MAGLLHGFALPKNVFETIAIRRQNRALLVIKRLNQPRGQRASIGLFLLHWNNFPPDACIPDQGHF